MKTVDNRVGDGDTLGSNAAILSGCGGSLAAGQSTEPTGTAAGAGGAVVRSADGAVEVELQLTEVRSRDDAIGSSVEGIASRDGQVDDLLELAGRRVVTKSLFNNVAGEMVNLLLPVAESRGTDSGTVELVCEPLDLTPSLTSTLGAALVVRVDLVGNVEKVLGELLADDG
jgi:hypothetical protein